MTALLPFSEVRSGQRDADSGGDVVRLTDGEEEAVSPSPAAGYSSLTPGGGWSTAPLAGALSRSTTEVVLLEAHGKFQGGNSRGLGCRQNWTISLQKLVGDFHQA